MKEIIYSSLSHRIVASWVNTMPEFELMNRRPGLNIDMRLRLERFGITIQIEKNDTVIQSEVHPLMLSSWQWLAKDMDERLTSVLKDFLLFIDQSLTGRQP